MVVKFASGMTTLTPGLAKRAGTVFAAAPMVQGKWDGSGISDRLSFAPGSVISGNWYANLDLYQGSVVFWITPEWSGNDGKAHAILDTQSSSRVALSKGSDNNLVFTVGTKVVAVSVAGWTAGTTYCIVCSWDSRLTLDGTNYLRLSINDVHTFGGITAPVVTAPATVYVGNYGGASSPANARISGLTIYRRPLWDGTYGINVGNGDEVALISAGADPCTITGSYDVTFCLPTNATVGALVTGTGCAWSHPHGSALLGDSWCQTPYATPGAWATYGAPSAGPSDQADATKIFQWGYQWTCNGAGDGVTQTKAGQAAGANYVMRLIAHCISANVITVQVWDNTNGAAITTYSFGASSTRTAPGVALITWELPTVARNGVVADCVSIAVRVYGAALNQVIYLHQCEIQANLIDNPSMETGAVADPWIPDGWTTSNLDAGDTQKSSAGGAVIHSGSDCVQWNVGANAEALVFTTAALALNSYLAVGCWTYGDTTRGLRLLDNADHASLQATNISNPWTAYLTAATWGLEQAVIRVKTADVVAYAIIAAGGAAGARYSDDAFCVALAPVSLTATPASSANSVESGGLRVDGRDSCTQDVTGQLAATVGDVYFRIRPRHAPDDLIKWLEVTNTFWCCIQGDATHYIVLYSALANRITMEFNDGGGVHSVNWDCTGAWYANDLLDMHIRYTPSCMDLMRGVGTGTILASIVTPIDFGAVMPNTAYWGSDAAGAKQGDVVFSDPVFMNIGGRHGMRDGGATRDRSERIGHPTFRH